MPNTPDPQAARLAQHLRDARRRVQSTLVANADRLSTPFTDDPGKNPWDTFVRPAMRELKTAVDAVCEALAAVPSAAETTNRADGEAPADWIDGHPQLEAIAAAVWERCEHHDSGLIIDDPRNIAVAVLAAVLPRPADGPSRVAAEEQPAETQDDSTTLLALVRDFLDPDPCSFDHHGYCQAHAAGFGGEPLSCPHGRARKLLAAAAPAVVAQPGKEG